MPFQKGQSGNPPGRPPGSRNRATIFAEVLLDGEAEMIHRNLIRAAVDGEPWAVRLCIDRMSPRLRTRAAPIAFELPQIRTAADIPAAIAQISSALAVRIWLDLSGARRRRPRRGHVHRCPRWRCRAGGQPPIWDWAIDNPIVVSNGDAEPGGQPPTPNGAIDNPIVVSNGDAEPGERPPTPNGAIDNPVVVSNRDAEPGGQPPIPNRTIDNSTVVSNGDAQPGRAPPDPEPVH
jgi:hypothetical protein